MPPSSLHASQAGASPRGSLRERLLFIGPVLALGLVLLMLWGFVAWFSLIYPKALLDEQRRELAGDTKAATVQTEGVLRDAENSLRTVDLWLLTRGQRDPLNDVSLAQLAETLRETSRELVDVMLITRSGQVFRIPSGDKPYADISDQEFFSLLAAPTAEGLSVGLPLRLRSGGPLQLPLAMRLSAPSGELLMVMALIDLQRLSLMHANFARVPEGAVTLIRGDGIALARTPELVGFAGRDLFADRPARRKDFSGNLGFFTTDGSATDGRKRLGAFQNIGGFGLKLLISQGENASLAGHLQQRRWVLVASSLISLLASFITIAMARLQRAARHRDAALLATSNAAPLGLFRCDPQGRVTYANDTYLRLHGLSADQTEWGWLDLIPAKERASVREQWRLRMSTGEPVHVVRKMRRGNDGAERLMSIRTSPLLVNGRVVGQAGTLEDITDRAAQEKALQTLTAIFDMTPDYVCQINPSGKLQYLNPAARQRLRLPPDADLSGINFMQYISTERVQRFQDEVLPTAQREGHWHGRSGVLDENGIEIPVDSTVLIHRNSRDHIETVSILMRDISAELQALRERQRSEAMLLAVADTAPALIAVMDCRQHYLFFNETFASQFGVQREAWVGRPVRELIGEADYARSQVWIEQAMKGQRAQIEKSYGEGADALLFEVQYWPLLPASGVIEGVICIARDITHARREETRLRHASQTDPLTQLLNRSGFTLGADEQLAQARQHNSLLGLLYLDLDRFKPVNDQHGHPVGDALLKAVAGRLRHALRPEDLVARLGGDEFAVLLPALAHANDAEVVAAKLIRAIAAPFMLDELQLEVGVSVGYCVAPGGQADMEAMVAQADAKLYEAKREGRGRLCGTVLKAL